MDAALDFHSGINQGVAPVTYGQGDRPPRGDYGQARADYTCDQHWERYTAADHDLYRRLYRPSERHPTPQATICVWALAADGADEARFHAMSRERWRLDRQRGVLGPLQAPAVIAERGYTADELPTVNALRERAFVGTGPDVARRLQALADSLGPDELVINTWAHDPAVRRRSYALLADAFAASRKTNPSEP